MVIVTDEFGNVLSNRRNQKPAELTNNQIECLGILEALRICEDGDEIYTDSLYAYSQIYKKKALDESELKSFVEKIQELVSNKKATIIWVSRVQNKAGDFLRRKINAEARKRNSKRKSLRKIQTKKEGDEMETG